jgi:hypothetical protein
LSEDQIKEIVEQAISKDLGGFVMTLAEKLRNEGELRGEIKGEIKAFREGIELGITYKFPGDIDAVMTEVNKIDDPATLKEITKAVHTAKDISEIMALLK